MLLVRQLLAGLWNSVGVALLFVLPMVILGWLLHRRRRKLRAESEEPFTDMPLRPPGEALRLKIEDLSEEFDSSLVLATLVSAAATAIVLMSPSSQRLAVGGVLLGIVVIAVVYVGRRIYALQKELLDYRLGFMGERVVGEELNQLIAEKFRVFNDVPFDGFNIDHVLVGPPGVYAVETKARRKPADIKGKDRAKVTFDGDILRFPNGRIDASAVAQARLNAQTLGKWLTKATGERVTASAILTLPGWFIERKAVSDVNVLNPGEIKFSFPNHPTQPLAAPQIQQIAHQLEQRCRLEKEPKSPS